MNHPVTTNCASVYSSSRRSKNEQHPPLLPMMTFSEERFVTYFLWESISNFYTLLEVKQLASWKFTIPKEKHYLPTIHFSMAMLSFRQGRTSRLIPQSPGSPLRSELRNPRCRVPVGVLWELRFRHRWWNQHPMPWRSFLRCGSKSNLVTSQREFF